jgi:hypothetical protein
MRIPMDYTGTIFGRILFILHFMIVDTRNRNTRQQCHLETLSILPARI